MRLGRRALASGFVITLVTSVAACSGSDSGGAGTSTSTASGTGGGGTGGGANAIACEDAPADLALGGTWAAYGRLAVSLKGVPGGAITICPTDQIGESTMLLLVKMDADAADPKKLTNVTATLCSIELPTVTALVGDCNANADNLVSTQIIVPPPLLAALPTIHTAPVGGTLSGTAPGSSVDFDRVTVTVGSTKAAPDLPRWNTSDDACEGVDLGRTAECEAACVSDCGALHDDDLDALPGVTAEVCGRTPDDAKNGVPCNAETPNEPGASLQGRAFLAMQVDPKFSGTAKSSCELAGTVDSQVLYDVVGADLWLAGAKIGVTSAIESLPSFEVDAEESKFRMIRVDGKYGAPDWKLSSDAGLACQTILAHVNEL
jgi:hypothetical protein